MASESIPPCDEIWTCKVFDLWLYLPTLLFSLQLFLAKYSFRHLIFQVNKMSHKLLILSPFLQLCYHLIWKRSMHVLSNFALYHSLLFWLWGLKNTGAQNHQHLAFAVLPRFQLLLQCTKSLAMHRLSWRILEVNTNTCRATVWLENIPVLFERL